ncbi:MAG: hypothetical protein J6K32_00585 [Clostridia bacterium]|nr:hypothetical protein [Clostridia bacterium]
MRACRLLLAALILILSAQTAQAQGWAHSYGGRGEDRLYTLIAAEDGLLGAGYAYSTDGDLSSRRRTGKTGWLLRLDAQGEVLWSYTSTHVGRDTFKSPFVHGDGMISAVLDGEGKGSEWVLLSAEGRAVSRMEIPEAAALCGHDAGADVWPGVPMDVGGGRRLAVLCCHADGSLCCAAMDEQGTVSRGALLDYAAGDLLASDGRGRLLQVSRTEDGLRVRWITPGSADAPQECRVAVGGGRIDVLLDVLAYDDGSVIVSAQLEAAGNIIARVSESGELLFSTDAYDNIYPITATQSGFAGANTSKLCFYDEDGALIGEAQKPSEGDGHIFVDDMARFGGGAALLQTADMGSRRVRITALDSYEPARDETYDAAIYMQTMASVQAAQTAGEEIVMTCRYDGRAVRTAVDAGGNVRELADGAFLSDGYCVADGVLLFEETAGGALVTLMGGDGTLRWQTKTPIHTAADRLQWRCGARLENGGYLIGGCYLSDSAEGTRQQGVAAYLSAEGVLQEILMPKDLTCICAILPGGAPGQTLVMASLNEWTDAEAVVVARLGREEWGDWTRMPIDLQTQGAYLLRGADGMLLAAGTSLRHGRENAVLFALDEP